MAATDAAAHIEQLGTADVAGGLALTEEVGWNQTLADWQLFLDIGVVFGIRREGRLVATAALLPMPPITWISLVIVATAHRRAGLAGALMRRCLVEAERRGLQPWLDATPAGATVYRPLGFGETGLGIRRFRRPGTATPSAVAATEPAHAVEDLIEADADAFGIARPAVLRQFCARSGSRVARAGEAMALVREGRSARHIGPVVGSDATGAVALLADIARVETGPLLIDVSDKHPAVADLLLHEGFTVERPFTRMCVGAPLVAAGGTSIAGAGPEYG